MDKEELIQHYQSLVDNQGSCTLASDYYTCHIKFTGQWNIYNNTQKMFIDAICKKCGLLGVDNRCSPHILIKKAKNKIELEKTKLLMEKLNEKKV